MTTRIDALHLQAPAVAERMQQRSLIIGLVFSVICGALAFVWKDEFFRAYLLAYMFWLGISLGSLAILMITHVSGGNWGLVIRRQLEAAAGVLPLMAVLFFPIIIGMSRLYVWTHPERFPADKQLARIAHLYLTTNGFILRAVIYFVVWLGLTFLLTRASAAQDRPSTGIEKTPFKMISGPGLILYAFTISFAIIDWVMSLDPHWISTIYGAIFIAAQCLSALCLAVVVESIFARYDPMKSLLRPKEVHDHSKLILAFIMLWAYFSFSQLLIIWAGNLPHEITWFTRRLYGGWQLVGMALFVLHFVVPFLLLLSRPFKRRTESMIWLASWVLVMRYVDVFWHIEANFSKTFHVTLLDLLMPFAIGGLWLWLFFRNVRKRPLLPLYDPHVPELLEPAHEH
jgi:hypothetical protein